MPIALIVNGTRPASITSVLGSDADLYVSVVDADTGEPVNLTAPANLILELHPGRLVRSDNPILIPVTADADVLVGSGVANIPDDAAASLGLYRGWWQLYGNFNSGDGVVGSVSVSDGGAGYTALPTVTAVGGTTGTPATLSPVMAATAITPTAGGSSYVVGDLLTLNGGNITASVDPVVQVSSVGGSGEVLSVDIIEGGSIEAISDIDNVTAVGGSGNSVSFGLVMRVLGVTVSAAGTGYNALPAITFSGGGVIPTQATAAAFLSGITILISVDPSYLRII